jgi:hypothetical protein
MANKRRVYQPRIVGDKGNESAVKKPV